MAFLNENLIAQCNDDGNADDDDDDNDDDDDKHKRSQVRWPECEGNAFKSQNTTWCKLVY